MKESLYYLGVKPGRSRIGLVLINHERLKCDAWETSFIVYEGTSGTIIESAETPGAFLQVDTATLKIKQAKTSDDKEDQKE